MKKIEKFYDIMTKYNWNEPYVVTYVKNINNKINTVVQGKITLRQSIYINCEGGVGRDNPIIKWAYSKRYIEFRRKGIPKWSKEFRQHFGPGKSLHGRVFRTTAWLTEQGQKAIQAEMARRKEKVGGYRIIHL